MSGPWHPAAPGPLVTHAHGPLWNDLIRELRELAGRHDDTAWVHPAPPGDSDGLGPLSIALCEAIGAIGHTPPPTAGERHLLRGLTHLLHSPIRHLIVDDPINLDAHVLVELHQICLIASVQLWLIVDAGDNTRGRAKLRDLLDHLDAAGTRLDHTDTLARWHRRTDNHPHCHTPSQNWWSTFHHDPALPPACPDHTATDPANPAARTNCFLSKLQRAITRGHLAANTARAALNAYAEHVDATPDDRWALTAANRDYRTAGMDALAHLHPAAASAAVADVAVDGSHVNIDGTRYEVPTLRRTPLARLRTSRQLAGVLPHEPVAGSFAEPDFTRTANPRTRRVGQP